MRSSKSVIALQDTVMSPAVLCCIEFKTDHMAGKAAQLH